jgi:maintenance of morphology protein 1
VSIIEFEFGSNCPMFGSPRVVGSETMDRLRNEIEFNYKDTIKFTIETHLVVNWPKPMTASLPIVLRVSDIEIGGTVRI